jgi:intraflagellar transport protein 88
MGGLWAVLMLVSLQALHTYQLIVKNKQYQNAGRLRVNMGNIYYEQKKYPNAIKMYRMALDQVPNTSKEVRPGSP